MAYGTKIMGVLRVSPPVRPWYSVRWPRKRDGDFGDSIGLYPFIPMSRSARRQALGLHLGLGLPGLFLYVHRPRATGAILAVNSISFFFFFPGSLRVWIVNINHESKDF